MKENNSATRLIRRLKRLNIDIILELNAPWVYLYSVNGVTIREKYLANHGYCAFMLNENDFRFVDRKHLFKTIRGLL